MDRFIDQTGQANANPLQSLKSNMDRFIGFEIMNISN